MSSTPPAEERTLAFLHAHGITTGGEGLAEMLQEAVGHLHATLYPSDPTADLPADEVAALRRGGFDLVAREGGRGDALDVTAAEYGALLATSVTTKQAAQRLGVAPSRVRQRLTEDPASLYGVRFRNGWRLPEFQFLTDGTVPGFGKVMRRLDTELHPVAVQRWFTLPHTDLVPVGSDDSMSPRDWLRLGYPVEVVVELAGRL